MVNLYIKQRTGNCAMFKLTSSFLYGETKENEIGIVVLFTDITEVARLNRQRRESSTIFAVLMICVCLYLFCGASCTISMSSLLHG